MPIDPVQLARLIEAHAGALGVWIRARCACPEDVVQEAFCKLAAHEPSPANPVPWLYRVCRNLAHKQRRGDARRRQRERQWAPSEVAAIEDSPSIGAADVVAAVETLDEPLREVLVARLWGRLSLEEVGKLCGISTTTAFRRHEAAIDALRAKLVPKVGKHHEQ